MGGSMRLSQSAKRHLSLIAVFMYSCGGDVVDITPENAVFRASKRRPEAFFCHKSPDTSCGIRIVKTGVVFCVIVRDSRTVSASQDEAGGKRISASHYPP